MEQAGALPEPCGLNSVHAVLCQYKELSTYSAGNIRWRQAFHAVMKYSGCRDNLRSAAVSSGSRCPFAYSDAFLSLLARN